MYPFPPIYPYDLSTTSYFTLTNFLYCTSTVRDKLFSLARQALLGLLIVEVFAITFRHTAFGGIPLDE